MHNKEKMPENRQNGGRVALSPCISPQKNAFRGHNKDLFCSFGCLCTLGGKSENKGARKAW